MESKGELEPLTMDDYERIMKRLDYLEGFADAIENRSLRNFTLNMRELLKRLVLFNGVPSQQQEAP